MHRAALAIFVAFFSLSCLITFSKAAEPEEKSFVSLVKPRPGQRTLLVNYPWKVHARPSIEVRLISKKAEDPREARPLFFVGEYFKGEVLLKIYDCLDAAAKVGTTKPLKVDDIEMEIIGRRNSLGKPAVCIARKIIAEDNPAPGAAAVFCHLPDWSANKATLSLDLPREYFAESGELCVWFLRGNKVLWEQRMDWPGYGK